MVTRSSNFKISSKPSLGLENIRVCDLFIPSHSNWDVELVNEIFNDRDAREILSIPLSGRNGHDCLV